MDLDLRNKAVLVTGGSRGIGRQIALAFAQEGANVAICAREAERLAKTGEEIRAFGGNALTISADLAVASECQRVVDETAAAFGGIYALINNASNNTDGPQPQFATSTDEQLSARIEGKAYATLRCVRAAIPYMQSSGGRIVCIAGLSARYVTRGRQRPTSEVSVLVAGLGNAMITNFSKMLSEENARYDILVNVVHPVIVNTDRLPRRIRTRAAELGLTETEAAADLASIFPIGRVIEPTDIASIVVFLASPLNGAITGQAIAVDGGLAQTVVY